MLVFDHWSLLVVATRQMHQTLLNASNWLYWMFHLVTMLHSCVSDTCTCIFLAIATNTVKHKKEALLQDGTFKRVNQMHLTVFGVIALLLQTSNDQWLKMITRSRFLQWSFCKCSVLCSTRVLRIILLFFCSFYDICYIWLSNHNGFIWRHSITIICTQF